MSFREIATLRKNTVFCRHQQAFGSGKGKIAAKKSRLIHHSEKVFINNSAEPNNSDEFESKPMSNTLEIRFSYCNQLLVATLASMVVIFTLLLSIQNAKAQSGGYYSNQEVVDAGHRFFGTTSGNLAVAFEQAFAKYGLPNGYILGEDAGGAFIGGLRYGEGVLYTKNAGDHKVFWQGPSIGWDYGGDGNRTMMLVYNLPSVDMVYHRYFGVSGSAFVIGGVGVTALTRQGVHLVPIRTGVGARLGVNVGYLKLRKTPRINPF